MTTALLATLTAANAQDMNTGVAPGKAAAKQKRIEARADERTAEMAAELGLNEEQTTKLGGINDQHAKAVAQLRQAGLSEEGRKERMKALRKAHDGQLKQVLTPEQYERMIALRKERKAADGEAVPAKAPHNE